MEIADVLLHFSERIPQTKQYALELYRQSLKKLKLRPEQITPETNLAGAYIRLGGLLAAEGRNREAIEIYKEGVSQTPNPAPRAFLAIALFGVGDLDESLVHIEEVLNIPPDELSEAIPSHIIQALRQYHNLIRSGRA